MAIRILFWVIALTVLKIVVAQNSGQQQTPPPTTTTTSKPPLLFSCKASNSEGKADIVLSKGTLTSDFENVTILSTNSHCTKTKNGSNFTLSGCDLDKNISIEVLHRPQGSKIQTEKYISRFILSCSKNKNDDKPYPIVVNSEILNVKNPTPNPINLFSHSIPTSVHLETTDFTMSISPKDNVVLGQQLTIDITTNETVSFKVKSCTASNENGNSNQPLWNETDNCSSPKSILFTGNWTQESKKVSHHVEAFRFDGGNKVIISCTLTICPNTNGCTQKCIKTTRKRRSVSSDSSPETRTVSASFSVAERAVNAAKGDTETPMYRWMFLMLYSVVVFGIL